MGDLGEENLRKGEDGRSENDGHHAGVVKLERQVLRGAVEHFIAHDPFGVLHGNAPLGLRHRHDERHHDNQEGNQGHEQHGSHGDNRAVLVHQGFPGQGDCTRKGVNNVDGNDEGNAVADAAFRNLVAYPHQEHGARHHNEHRHEGELDAGVNDKLAVRRNVETHGLQAFRVFQRADQEPALHKGNDDGDGARPLGHFLAAAFFPHHLGPLGNHRGKELGHDGSGNVGHDAQSKNAALLEAAAGENGQHGSQTRSGTAGVRGGFNHFLQLHDVNARQGNLYPQADDDNHRQCEQNPAPELRYFHGVCKCGYHGPVI